MQITKKKIAATIAATAVVALGASGAFAYWTTTGNGSGSAAAGTDAGVDIVQVNNGVGAAINSLHPGQEADIDFAITNGAAYNQFVGKVTITPTFSNGSTSIAPAAGPACTIGTADTNDFVVTQPGVLDDDLATGTYTYQGSATGAKIRLNNLGTNQDNCKNQVVSLAFAVSAN